MKTLLTFNNQQESTAFEINLVIRDMEGNPSSRRRSYKSNDSYKIWEFYQRNKGKPKRKRKGKSNSTALPTGAEAQSLLQKAAKYSEQLQQKRDGE